MIIEFQEDTSVRPQALQWGHILLFFHLPAPYHKMGLELYSNFFSKSSFIEKTLKLDVVEYNEEIRAAAAVVAVLGHSCVWPVEERNEHLELAAAKLEEILANDSCPVNESEEIVEREMEVWT